MNIFKKKHGSDVPPDWRKSTGSFIRKPAKGWIHPDHVLETSSVTYETQYIGAVKVLESVKSIPFEERGLLVREAISRCCDQSKFIELKKRKKSVFHERLGDIYLGHSGDLTSTTFSKSFIRTYSLRSGEKILDHSIQCISFASIGENEYKSIIGYISKDQQLERACFIFDCKGDVADDVILTIGQAFELKYKEHLNFNSGIQPVLKRFTDPVNDEGESDSHNTSLGGSFTSDIAEYSKLFSGSPVKVHPTASGYDSLHRNDNTSISDETTNSQLNFSPCPLYGEKEVNFAAIYDNPISSHGVEVERNAVNIGNRGSTGNGNSSEYAEMYDGDEYNENDYHVLEEEMDSIPCTSNHLDISKEKWFHGKISRDNAEKWVKNDGEFLVRESSSSVGQYVLTGMRDGIHRHILLIDPEGKVQTRDHSFKDIPDLVNFHHSRQIPIYSGSSEVCLKREILR